MRSQLSGANGEWTGTDDLMRRGHQQGPRRQVLINRGAARRGGNQHGPPAAGQQHAQQVAQNLANPNNPAGGNANPAPQPPPDPWPEWDDAANGMTYEEYEGNRELYVPADFPMTRSRHRHDFEPTPTNSNLFESNATPFCGAACIDLAVHNMVDFEVYEGIMGPRGPVTMATSFFLNRYANSLGVNLKIYEWNGLRWNAAWDVMNDPAWETVMLLHENFHYRLITTQDSDLNTTLLPDFDTYDFDYWPSLVIVAVMSTSTILLSDWRLAVATLLISILSFFRVVPLLSFDNYVYDTSNIDKRPVIDKLDPMVSHDVYCDCNVSYTLFWHALSLSPLWKETLRVSCVRFDQAYKDAQSAVINGIDPRKALTAVTSVRSVNTKPLASIYLSTAKAVTIAIKYSLRDLHMERNGAEHARLTYCRHGFEQALTSAQLELAQRRQAGLLGFGNKVLGVNEKRDVKYDRPIAVCLLPVYSNIGQIAAGYYPLTDVATLLGAFVIRSMTAQPKVPSEVEEFVKFSVKLMKQYVNETDIGRDPEPDVRTAYAHLNKGKKSAREIASNLENYERHLHGYAPKTFKEHSCFVKFENSAKEIDGVYRVKPRLIMTMSDLMSVECSPILELIHKWNDGVFGRFQIKGLEPEEMIEKITSVCFGRHEVTDYSSFEASIDMAIRKIENETMLALCRKAHWTETARSLRRHAFGARILKHEGGRFRIVTRCSGDYWTSFGNGVVNYCLMAYAASKNGIDYRNMRFVAEGDDGLVVQGIAQPKLLDKLGFKYSTSLSGTQPGDCDFLRSRWIDGKRYLSIGRVFSSFWIKKAHNLSLPKQQFLFRCIAYSLHHSSPGHPVVEAIVCRILKETGGAKRFKGYKRYLDTWGITQKNFKPIEGYYYRVDDTMRGPIAAGAGEFPPLPVADQIVLENTILHDKKIYVGRMLDGFADFLTYKHSHASLQPRSLCADELTDQMLTLFGYRKRAGALKLN